MKVLLGILLATVPVSAQAMGMHDGMQGDRAGMCVHLAVILYALVGALGYWVLQHSAKEAAGYVKKAGSALGWVLVVVGLLGVLCGAASHVRKAMSHESCRCSGEEMMGPDEMADMAVMDGEQQMPAEMMEQPQAAPKKK